MLYELSARASEVDRRTKAHPKIGFLLVKDGKPQDIQRACVDTRVPPQGKLVIWLMGHNRELFARVSSYGLHAIQPHYASGWFGNLYSGPPPRDDLFLSNIRLEAATGADHSKAVKIPRPDSIMERSYQFVKWLDRENPQGNWRQFLTRDGRVLEWDGSGKFIHENVWRYLFTHPVAEVGMAVSEDPKVKMPVHLRLKNS